MVQLLHTNSIKHPSGKADPIQIMVFDDESIVLLHFDTSKVSENRFMAEHWVYDEEDLDYYVKGGLDITKSMDYKEISYLTKKVQSITQNL